MDFTLTEAQQELASLTRRILTDRATPERLREVEASDDRFDRSLWKELAAAGVLDAVELGLLDQCSVALEIGRAVAPVPYLASIVMGASTLSRFGTTDQQARWAAQATLGDLVLTAALNAEETPRVEPTGDGWLLNATFTAVPAGPYADLILVPVGERVFLVEPGDEGVKVERQQLVDGDSAARLELVNVALAGDRVLTGSDIGQWIRDRATVGLCAQQLGITERALEMTASYATSRVQFGRAIGTFQAVAQRLADAYIDVEAIRLTMWQAAWRLCEGLPCETEISTAKFWAADGGHRVAHTAVHVHGGVGIDVDYPLHRYFVAAKQNEFALGHATEHLLRIGAVLASEQ
ncbi:MAG TPA: acyl-CoA dehydrogenase [Micromonosporaceae bacterium]|nr:acyl-CoA dehydrogenase [Micromonosporaceae bacterium]HCU51450.1 acyl-CoA dehydrogenase [Micromonosporaceae bacterium]